MRTQRLNVIVALLVIAASVRVVRAAEPKGLELMYESVVAPAFPENKPNYRIPSVVRAPNGDLLAFMERRQWGYSDISNNEMVCRRSTDDGKTWGKDEELVVEGNYANSDPSPLVDSKGRIWFFFMFDRKEIAVRYSDDSGRTWSKRESIHNQFVPPEWNAYAGSTNFKPHSYKENADMRANWPKGWNQRYGVGCGAAGIEIQEGPHKGRIIIGARVLLDTDDGRRTCYTYSVMTDDRGKTWRKGQLGIPQANENQIVELDKGVLFMNGRDADNKHQPDKFVRRLGYSYDGGETWTDFRNATDLLNPQCHGATKRYRHNGADVLLYTGPATTFRQDEKPYGRWNMSMQISRDGGKSWSAPQVFYKAVSSYSDMTIFDDGTIGVIYERGAEGTIRYWDELAFARFKIDLSKF